MIALLKTEIEKKGLKFGLYYSLYEWYNTKYLSDKRSGGKGKKAKKQDYVDSVVLPQLQELVQRYFYYFFFIFRVSK